MFAAGSAVQAAGDGLAANLSVLSAGFSAHTGVDRAGEVFGLAYQEKAESVLKAAAAAVNACRKCGALIQQGASNYSNVEAASTLGGGSGALKAPSPPAELAAPAPPGTWGPGRPPPPLWSLVQSFVLEAWPDGDVAGLHATASRWRAFGAAANGVQGTLNASKTLFDSQHIPEGEKIDNALSEIGSSAAIIGELCRALADTIETFANRVEHAQTAIRDLLRRIESLGDLGHDVMLIIDGDAWDEIKQIVKDINAVLQHLGQEARACEQAIKFLMEAADREVVTCERYARRGLVQFLGEDVGNPVATVADTWINGYTGVLKGAVGMGLGLVDLSPHWIAADPEGAAATWTGVVKNAWKESLINAAVNPKEFSDARLQELKGLVHAKDWTTARPGLGAGEVLFDGVTLIAPGLGEAGAAADGAGAAARGAEEEAEAAGGAAGRAGGEGAAGARGALTDTTKAGADVTKNLEGVTGDLPEIKPPAGGTPVGLPSGKPLEAPVEATPHPPDAAPSAPQGPSAPFGQAPPEASGPGAGGRPHELGPTPAAGFPHDPTGAPAAPCGPHDAALAPREAPAKAPAVAAGVGPHEPLPAPVGGSHEPVHLGGPHEPAESVERPLESSPGGSPREPESPPGADQHEPASVPADGPHDPAAKPAEAPHEPSSAPAERPHEPMSAPPGGTTLASVPAAMEERASSSIPQLAEHPPGRTPAPPGGSSVEPAFAASHSPQPASAAQPPPHSPPLGGRPAEAPALGHRPHLPGDSGPPGGRKNPAADGLPKLGDGEPHGSGPEPKPREGGDALHQPPENGPNHNDPAADRNDPSSTVGMTLDDAAAMTDYTGSGYLDLNDALRSNAVDASQQARVEAIRNALQKLPPYRGTVVRGTDLPSEVLAQYRPGEIITEKAFLSTTTNPAVARSTAFSGNVEFRIFSHTGRDVSSLSLFPGEREILFPAGTRFFVAGRTLDPLTGKTIIEMIER